jgi:general secretion pathway protein G
MRTCLRSIAGDAKSECRMPNVERSPKPENRKRGAGSVPQFGPRNSDFIRHSPFVIRHSGNSAARGFTLIEIMVVVIVIGILAATIIPQFMGTTHDAKVGAAKGHIAELESALERFNINMDRYPTMEEGLKALIEPPSGDEQKNWRGPYIKQLRNDPWGVPYQYLVPGTHHTSSFDLWSRGADKTDSGEGKGADIGNWQ